MKKSQSQSSCLGSGCLSAVPLESPRQLLHALPLVVAGKTDTLGLSDGTSFSLPSFVFLQLYHSPFFGDESNKPLLLPNEVS